MDETDMGGGTRMREMVVEVEMRCWMREGYVGVLMGRRRGR